MSQKYRILHLTHDMGIGGTEQVVCQLIRHLDFARYECEIACIDGTIGPLGQQLVESGVEIHALQRRPGFDLKLIKAIWFLLRERQYDIVHCHQYTPYVYGIFAALFTKVKVVFTEHGRFHPDTYSWKRRIVNPLLGCCTDSIVAISAATAQALVRYEWFSKKAINVIYNGIAKSGPVNDSEQLRVEFNLPENVTVFGTIARFDPIKNIPMMISAFDQVHRDNSNTRLVLVGDGAERQLLVDLVEQSGLTDAVVFTGYREDTSRFMSLIDVYLLTSFSEGTSMVLLEAMSTRTCSIVTNVGGNSEIIEHDVNGIIVESEDTQALVNWMCELDTDKDRRQRLGSGAHTVFNERFSVETMSNRYAATYDRVLGLR